MLIQIQEVNLRPAVGKLTNRGHIFPQEFLKEAMSLQSGRQNFLHRNMKYTDDNMRLD